MRYYPRIRTASKLFFITLWIAVVFLSPGHAEDASRSFKGESFVLENGLQVVVVPQRRVPIVTHLIAYKVGGADEPAGLSGMAHFFEHLMFKATKNHAAGELDAVVNAVGGD